LVLAGKLTEKKLPLQKVIVIFFLCAKCKALLECLDVMFMAWTPYVDLLTTKVLSQLKKTIFYLQDESLEISLMAISYVL
jgi:hypothetical protein